MSTLEVFQSCPAQRKLLFSALGAVDIQDLNLMIFNLENFTTFLPHQMAFQIPVIVKNKHIFHNVVDEGASTCIMSLKCWKSLGSPTINQSPTILKAFDVRGFQPYGILQDLPTEVEGKVVNLDVEVVDAPMDYNLLLGRSWSYAMTAVVSSIFHLIMFPHKGKIVKIDQLSYYSSDPASTDSIQHIGKLTSHYKDVRVGLLKDLDLLGTFSLPTPNVQLPIANINMITSSTMSFDDPWIVPPESDFDSFNGPMPLSPFELAYQNVQSFSDTLSTSSDLVNMINQESFSILSLVSTPILDPTKQIFHTDEHIREFLSIDELPWEDLHHRSSFLPVFYHFKNDFSSIFTTNYVKEPQNPHSHIDFELNLENISTTVPLDISVKPGIIENIHIGASCTTDEIKAYKALFQEFHDISPGHMKKFQELICRLFFMKLRHTRMLNPLDRDYVRYI